MNTTIIKSNHEACKESTSGGGCELQNTLKDDIENLMLAGTVEQQLAQLKVITSWRLQLRSIRQLLSKHSQMEDEGSFVFKLCSKIYFSVDPKHPIRSGIVSFPDGSLHMIPRKWLEETIEEITNDSSLCATRRSAGIPFMIQALVCTELSVGGGACFSTCMDKLFNLAANKECSVETRTHSLNILRALFRNSQLGEAVSLYVQDSFIIAITGFKSNAWPVSGHYLIV